jgi:hypothetical protein
VNDTATPDFYSAEHALAEIEAFLPEDAAIIPLKPREKRPLAEGWTAISATMRKSPDFRALFSGEVGIGLLCGFPSNGLCMVDLDSDEFVAQAESAFCFLKQAPRVRGERGCKWLVRTNADVRGSAVRNSSGMRIGEFLGSGQQGVVAGIHPISTLPYRWDRRGQIPLVDANTLLETLSCLDSKHHD